MAKEIITNIRTRLGQRGVKATVKAYSSCGASWVRISTRKYDQVWSDEDLANIADIAFVNGCYGARGDVRISPGALAGLTHKAEFHFTLGALPA